MVSESTPQVPRVIGRAGGTAGPVVITIAGIHGNEPAGVEALIRVHERIRTESIALTGELISLRGNRRALVQEERYLAHDLNRMWRLKRVSDLLDAWREFGTSARANSIAPNPEELEQVELFDEIAPYLSRRSVHLIDLHTASAASVPFGLIGDTLRNRPLASELPLPVLLGLEEHLEGSLLEAIGNFGHATLGVEGGQHRDPSAVDCIEAVVWVALSVSGLLGPRSSEWPAVVEQSRNFLAEVGRGYPRLVEVKHRHGIEPDDEFVMRPGFENFTRVVRGERLGGDRTGPVRSISDAHVLLPLYQGRGDDGFFLGRRVSGVREKLQRWARLLRIDRLVRLIPGVRRVPEGSLPGLVGAEILEVHHSDYFLRCELLPALGYRRARRRGEHWWLVRRPEWPTDAHEAR